MSKLRADFRVAMLGAAGGLFSVSVFLLFGRIDTFYTYLEAYPGDYRPVENLWWIPVVFWHMLLSLVSSLIGHRYLTLRRSSPFLLWQLIGVFSLLGWVLTFSVFVVLESLSVGNINSVTDLLHTVNLEFIAKYVAAVFACHVMYGSAIQASSREYLCEIEQPREVPVVIMNHRSFRRGSRQPAASISEKQLERTETGVASSSNFDRILLPRN
jgi:hypothetical protein